MRTVLKIQALYLSVLSLNFVFGASSAYCGESLESKGGLGIDKSQPINESAEITEDQTFHVTSLGGYNEDDTRHLYEVEVIRLILEKTKKAFGDFSLKEARGMSHSRSLEVMIRNKDYPNFIRSYGYTPEMVKQDKLTLIPFPLWRGLLGYRTCFTSDRIKDVFEHAQSMEELRKFTHGQGNGWIDADILRYNKFEVKEFAVYTSLFKMVAKNRFDLFCRGANEVREEFGRFSYIHGLAYDRSKVFYYPFPHFLYTHSENKALVTRIEAGIKKIVDDGTFEKLWRDFHKNNLRFIKLSERQYIRLENPFMNDFDKPYEHLIFKPLSPSPLP